MSYRPILFTLFLCLWFFPDLTAQTVVQETPDGPKRITSLETYDGMVREHPDDRLVDLEQWVDHLCVEVRYATENNFTHQRVYPSARVFARLPVARALQAIQAELKQKGLGIKVFDAYRPYAISLKFFAICPDTTFVASPRTGSRHNRGCAIDLTLVDLKQGVELEMPTPFDDFTQKAAHGYTGLTERQIRNRELLKSIMMAHGFEPLASEWWHYDFKEWRKYPLMDLSFDDLTAYEQKHPIHP
ncbi:MAG: M15 family metallopeptidase [Marinilabiliales bacterium]|nr:M15 family metallopeptidase [Marinilabiliales bacterium]